MKKIPTLFKRDPDDMKRVLPEVTPGCEWVLANEGAATRKYDGTCVLFDGDKWWVRREVKPGKQPPAGWWEADHDDTTGKRVGWEPAEQSGFAKYLTEAVRDDVPPYGWKAGTFELCGPKVNGNPEGFAGHVLIRHDDAPVVGAVADALPPDPERAYRLLERRLSDDSFVHEGIVWHHADGRMAKLKKRDFAASPSSGTRET